MLALLQLALRRLLRNTAAKRLRASAVALLPAISIAGCTLVVCLVSVACCTSVATAGSDDPQTPYTAYITANDVYVRSGPGNAYYPTQKMRKGDAIEVYREDPGGWLAIRPPAGSFSWVSTKFLDPLKGDIFEVNSERVASRVGSQFSDIRQVAQVRLDRGERVAVLDPNSAANGGQRWLKIAPPAGEFRWVHSKFIADQPPRENDGVSHDDQAPPELEEVPPPEGTRQSRTRSGSSRSTAALPVRSTRTRSSRPTPRPPRRDDQAFQESLDKLNLNLSTMVAEEPTAWSFEDMRTEASSLVDQAENAVEKGRARMLVAKIDKFENLKQRYVAQNRTPTQTILSGDIARLPAVASRTSGYDAVGVLRPIVSSVPTPGGPRYALFGDDGNVQYFVTSAPGLNLQHYIGRRVGVSGILGYQQELNSRHVTAQRVSVLDGTTIR